MARARLSLSARAPAPPVLVRTPPRVRWAIAAGLLGFASAAMGAATYAIRAHWGPPPVVAPVALTPAKAAIPALPHGATAVVPSPSDASDKSNPVQRPSKAVASDELRLLRQARAAVASKDFADALSPLAEHARRFKDGRMTEEREALRVKALAGLGRTDEARRAAVLFEARFPRSVLLPTVKRMPTAEP